MNLSFSGMLFLGNILVIVFVTILVAFLVNRFFRRLIRRSAEDTKSDPTNYQFLRYVITATIYIVGFSIAVYQIPGFKTLATSMLAGAGILTVAIGFASQQALSNIISGVFIVLFKPFRVNDRLTLRTFSGFVEDITLRHTVIRDFENKRILVPILKRVKN
ncbi:MAG: mechanosensitive ion channel domain-containing protein [Bacteroidota bacterium]